MARKQLTKNTRVNRFEPWYNYIRNERHFSEQPEYTFIEDEKGLPMSETYGVNDPNVQHNAASHCLKRHAPLKCVKITRSPVNIRSLSLQARWRYILGGTCPRLKFLKWATLHQRRFEAFLRLRSVIRHWSKHLRIFYFRKWFSTLES